MPLGLLGGCTDRCGSCVGCFGGLDQDGCKLRWATSGNPYQVEVRRSGVVISVMPSGFIVNPSSGIYELWIKCKSGDDWELVDTESWVQKPPRVCRPCCIESGAYSGYGATAYAILDFGTDPFWSLFSGTIQLSNQIYPLTCSCKFVGSWWQIGPTLGDGSNTNPINGRPCPLPVGLDSVRKWFAGTITYGPCPGRVNDWEHIYDVYWIPNSVIVNLGFGGDPNSGICNTSYSGMVMTVQIAMGCFLHRRDLGNPAFINQRGPKCWESAPLANGYGDGPFLNLASNDCGNITFMATGTEPLLASGYGCATRIELPRPGPLNLKASVVMP